MREYDVKCEQQLLSRFLLGNFKRLPERRRSVVIVGSKGDAMGACDCKQDDNYLDLCNWEEI